MTYQLLHGDCRTLMSGMAEASVDSVVTDAPYELGFMGRSWDSTGVAYDVETWRAALRVLKPGGWLVCFGGARTYHRMACAIEDAGFEIRDQIMWIYGSGFPKGGNRDGKGTCLKPAHEPIVLARKPLIGSVAANEARYGTGAINIDACRVATHDNLNGGAYSGDRRRRDEYSSTDAAPGAVALSRLSRGIGAYQAPAGRWPANIVHDGSDDVVAAFPVAPGQQGDLRNHANSRQSPNGIFGGMRPALDHPARGDSGSAARFFYCAKASKADRDDGLDAFEKVPAGMVSENSGQHLARREADAPIPMRANTHPTVKPEALMRWLVRLVTPEGGLVLDPFTGSGSTGKAALLEDRRFVGCELTDDYLPIAHARIAAAAERAAQAAVEPPQYDMFAGEAA